MHPVPDAAGSEPRRAPRPAGNAGPYDEHDAALRAGAARARLAGLILACAVLSGCAQAEGAAQSKAPSQYNTIIVTEGADGLRTLLFERRGARQSGVDPDDPA